jgi:multicomponent Na+:H+ antiporter subunit G
MREIITSSLILFGAFFMLLAAVGIVRLPDLFMRMHAATKSGTLGVSGMILAVAVHFGDLGIAMRSALIIVFIFMTAPVAAHFIARAAYIIEVPLWENTVTDELRGKYDHETGQLAAAPEIEIEKSD